MQLVELLEVAQHRIDLIVVLRILVFLDLLGFGEVGRREGSV